MQDKELKLILAGITAITNIAKIVVQHRNQCRKNKTRK